MSALLFHAGNEETIQAVALWQELDDAIRGVVDQYTIEDLARWQEAAK